MRSKKSTLGARLGRHSEAPGSARSAVAVTSAADPTVAAAMGLRERKKMQTRLHISDVATALFLDRGFDEVTVAEVARAANVSVKTVFNYFGAKEDLLFDREPEWLASIDALGALCEPGHGLIRVLGADVSVRWPALDFGRWDRFTDDAIDGRRAFYRLVDGHPGLQARACLMSMRIGARLSALAAATFDDPASQEAVTAGALIGAAYDVTGREYARELLTGSSAEIVSGRARAAGLHALGLLERTYAGTPLVEGPPA